MLGIYRHLVTSVGRIQIQKPVAFYLAYNKTWCAVLLLVLRLKKEVLRFPRPAKTLNKMLDMQMRFSDTNKADK